MLKLNFAQIRDDVLFLLKPAFEDWGDLDKCVTNIHKYIDQTVQLKDIELCHYVFDKFKNGSLRGHEYREKENASIIKSTIDTYDKLMANISTPGLGFGIITNNALDAALYTSMNKHQMEKQYKEQSSSATNYLYKTLSSVKSNKGLWSSEIEKVLLCIDELLITISRLDESYDTYNKYNRAKFRTKWAKEARENDIELGGISVYRIIDSFYRDKRFVIDGWKLNERDELMMLARFGYVNVFYKSREGSSSTFFYPCFTTTGKFERTIEEKETKKILENSEKDNIYKEAECELEKSNYYKAATLFGQIAEYKNARIRSFDLWNNIIQKFDLITDAIPYHPRLRDCNGTLVINEEEKHYIRKWYTHDNPGEVTLTFDGEFKCGAVEETNVKNVYRVGGGYLLVYADGTAKYIDIEKLALNYSMSEITNYKNIKKIDTWGEESAILLTEEGEVSIFGELKKKGFSFNGWHDIIDFVFSKRNGYIIGLSKQGDVYVTVERDPLNTNREILQASRWKDIVKIGDTSYFAYGIRKDGTVKFASNKNIDHDFGYEEKSEMAFLSSIKDVVDIHGSDFSHYCYALKLDGTIVTPLCIEGEQKQKYVYVDDGDIISEIGETFELGGNGIGDINCIIKHSENTSWGCSFDEAYNSYRESIIKCYKENKQALSETQEILDKQKCSFLGFLKSKKKLVATINSVKSRIDFMESEYDFL